MNNIEEAIRYHVNKRQKWETFGGKPLGIVWGLVISLSVLAPLSNFFLPILFGSGLVAQIVLNFKKRKSQISLAVQIMWVAGAVIAFFMAYLLPLLGFFSNLDGQTFSYLIWGGIIFYTGSIKARWLLVMSGFATVGISVALAAGLNGLLAAGIFAATFFISLALTTN